MLGIANQILNDLINLSPLLQFILLLIGLIYGKKQLDESLNFRRLHAVLEMFDEIGTARLRRIRAWLYESFPKGIADINDISDNDIEKIKEICVAYDRIAFLSNAGLLPFKELVKFQGKEIVKIWNIVKPVILHIRKNQDRSDYCHDLEFFANKLTQKKEAIYYA